MLDRSLPGDPDCYAAFLVSWPSPPEIMVGAIALAIALAVATIANAPAKAPSKAGIKYMLAILTRSNQ